ncbi:MAG: hypothetical protein PHS42_03670 [Sulfurimonas sp.]|nr:hypothetical protein [Sulfurimonas sp.]MDD3834551.1 hypothetical protein [Sulfurimonas sp.]
MKKIITNYYPAILWDIPVFGLKREVKSNLYKKEIATDENFTYIKSDLVESGLSTASMAEIWVLKYLPIVLAMYVLFSVNMYYPSMLGLSLASLFYAAYSIVKIKGSEFFANLGLFIFSITYIILYIAYFRELQGLKINAIINYAIQYSLMIFMFEKLVMDILLQKYKGWKKVDKVNLSYVKLFSAEDEKRDKALLIEYRKYFFGFLGTLAILTFILGGGEFYKKVMIKSLVETKIMAEDKNEKAILNQKSAKAMEERLLNQAKNLGIKISGSDIELLRTDFDKYIETRPIAYELVRVNENQEIAKASDGSEINIDFRDRRFITIPTFVQLNNGVYRWHFIYRGVVCIISNATARER